MKRLRLMADGGFWKPCLHAMNADDNTIKLAKQALAQLRAVVPFANKLYLTVDGKKV